MKNIKGYVNAKTDLDLINLRIKFLEEKLQHMITEKEALEKLQEKLVNILRQIEEKLKELKGIERELFYEIMVKGTNVTKAVDKVSITYDVDPSTIWKYYYPKIKEDIKKLEKEIMSSEILV